MEGRFRRIVAVHRTTKLPFIFVTILATLNARSEHAIYDAFSAPLSVAVCEMVEADGNAPSIWLKVLSGLPTEVIKSQAATAMAPICILWAV